ncbi:MAG: outer membrane protein assembly factor BamB family protein [Vulcanimicrobiaceae bacterium]
MNGGLNPIVVATMRPQWTLETGGPISASPTYANGTVYVGNNAGTLYALDPLTGAVRWSYQACASLMAAPLVHDGTIVLGAGDVITTYSIVVKDRDPCNRLIALDAQTHKERWSVALTGSGMPSGAILGNVLFHHDSTGMLLAFNLTDGTLLWHRYITTTAYMSALLPVGERAFVTTGTYPNQMLLVRTNGAATWIYHLPKTAWGSGDCPPATDGERIFCDYLTSPDQRTGFTPGGPGLQWIYAVRAKDGKRAWERQIETGTIPERNEASIPLVANGRLYVGSAIAPYMHAVDARTGALLWRVLVRGTVLGGIVAKDGCIYFGDTGGYLWALDSASGATIGVKYMGTPFNVGSPIVLGNSLLIGSNTGRIAAVPLDSIRAAHDSAVPSPAPHVGNTRS